MRQANAQLHMDPPGPSQPAEYALLRMRLLFAASPGTPNLAPAICLFPGGNPSALLPGKPGRARAEGRMHALERALFQGQRPGLGSSEFAAAAAAAAGHEIRRLQGVLTSLAQQVSKHRAARKLSELEMRCSPRMESTVMPAYVCSRQGWALRTGTADGPPHSQALWPPSRPGKSTSGQAGPPA